MAGSLVAVGTAALFAAGVPTSALAGTVAASPPAGTLATARCTPRFPDFNGDGCADLAIADPDAAVSGRSGAGRIIVWYGAESGSGVRAVLAQGQPAIGGTAESGDRFGTVVRAGYLNRDWYADLVVGTPTEDIGDVADAGIIHVIFGSADGLGNGRPSVTLRQGLHGVPGAVEAGDRLGASLAINTTGDSNEPWPEPAIAYGVPGEDIGSVSNAGSAGLVTFDGDTGDVADAHAISQNSEGIAGSAEAGDRFGAAVEVAQGMSSRNCLTDGTHGFTLLVGAPGEDLAGVRDAGVVHLARDLSRDVTVSQESSGVSGAAEPGDQFGASLAVDVYCTIDGPETVTLAVGVPTEDIGSASDAGAVHLFRTGSPAQIPPPQAWSVNQDTEGVDGTAEPGDRFGSTVLIGGKGRTGPGIPVVVSAPGEDIGDATDAGTVQVFGDRTTQPGDGDLTVHEGTVGGSPQDGDHFGAALAPHSACLFVGVPDDSSYRTGVVYGVSWETVYGTAPEPSVVIVPGADGVPTGAVRFGAALG